MRLLINGLGILALVLSVALGSGGVAIQAGASECQLSEEHQTCSAEVEVETNEPERCDLPKPTRRSMTLNQPGGAQATPLNTRGYNYLKPGDYRLSTPAAPASN